MRFTRIYVVSIYLYLERVAAVVKSVVGSDAFNVDVRAGRHRGTLLVARKAGEGSHVASGRRDTWHR
eukprot:scaffold2022_cov63-Phaeocystis_antarctica.AAC.6